MSTTKFRHIHYIALILISIQSWIFYTIYFVQAVYQNRLILIEKI